MIGITVEVQLMCLFRQPFWCIQLQALLMQKASDTQRKRSMRIIETILSAIFLSLGAAHAADSSFLCKQIDSDSSLIFSATSVVSIDAAGNYGKPVEVTFGYPPNGNAPVWSTLGGSTRFILMKEQIYVMDALGNVHGKIVCE